MPNDRKDMQLAFPALGLDRRWAQQRQPPYSSADMSNVRLTTTTKGRARGGSRPGLGRAYWPQLGSGNPVRGIWQVSYLKNDGFAFWEDYFKDATIGSIWTTASWIGTAPSIFPDNLVSASYNQTVGVVRDALSPFDQTQNYIVEIFCVPWEDQHQGKYQIFLRMNDTTPVVTTDGILVELVMEDNTGAYAGTAKRYSGGSLSDTYTFTSGTTTVAKAAWFTCQLSGTTLTVYWDGNLILTQVITAPASGGKRFGFGTQCTQSGNFTLIDTFRVQYYRDSISTSRRDQVMVTCNGTVYRETFYGQLESIGGSVTLNTDRNLQATEYLQKLYIADYGEAKAIGTDGVRGTGNTKFDSATYTDWTALATAIATADDVLVIYGASGSLINGTYGITTVASGELTLDRACATDGTGTCSFYIMRGPKVYDPKTNVLSLWMTAAISTGGSVPVGCPCIARFHDRICLAGNFQAPHNWNLCRQGDALDFLDTLDLNDVQRPMNGQDSTAGLVGQPITALAPHRDDYLILASDRAIYVMRGDPAYNGFIDCLSETVGFVDKTAFCRGPDGELIFLTREGIYGLPASANAVPTSMSHERLPRELLDYSPALHTISLAFDVRGRGVHIYLTQKDSKLSKHWWFDWEQKGFWPVSLPQTMEPTAVCAVTNASAEDSCVLLGGRDGYVRRYRDSCEHDDGTSITSYVVYGPFSPFGDFADSILMELQATLADISGPVTWAALPGETAEDALSGTAYAHATGTFNEDLNYSVRPRTRGLVYIKLNNQSSRRAWAIESFSARFRMAGKARKQ